MNLPILRGRLLGNVLEEGQNLLVDPVTVGSPLAGPAEDPGTFTEFREMKLLGPGESAHIPMDVVHGTYNAGDTTLVFLAILSPAKIEGPPLIDMKDEEPWKSLRDVD